MFDPLPLACTDAHRRVTVDYTRRQSNFLQVNCSGEGELERINRIKVEVICRFQVCVSLLFHFITKNYQVTGKFCKST